MTSRIVELMPVHAAVTLRRKALDERRVNLSRSESIDTLLQSQLSDLELDLETAEYASFLPIRITTDKQDRPFIPPPRYPSIPISTRPSPRLIIPNNSNPRKFPPLFHIRYPAPNSPWSQRSSSSAYNEPT